MNRKFYTAAAVVLIAISGTGAFAQKGKVADAPSVPDVVQIPGGQFSESYIISESGSYRLAGDRSMLNGSAVSAIVISAPNVTLDLGGHTISGVGTKSAASGIEAVVPVGLIVENVRVFNGTVQGFGNTGLLLNVNSVSVESVRSLDNGARGIHVALNGTVMDCMAMENGTAGIQIAMGRVLNTVASYNGTYGIAIGTGRVEGCEVGNNVASGIQCSGNSIVRNNRILYNNTGNIGWASGVVCDLGSQIVDNYFCENKVTAIRASRGTLVRGNSISNAVIFSIGITAYGSGVDHQAVAKDNVFSGQVNDFMGLVYDAGGNVLMQGAY